MNQLALATYAIEMGQENLAQSNLNTYHQTLLHSIKGILEIPAQSVAKIIADEGSLTDWSVV